jgi:WW domain.
MKIYTPALAIVLSYTFIAQVTANGPGSSISGAHSNRLYDGGDRRFYNNDSRLTDPQSYLSQRGDPSLQGASYYDTSFSSREELEDKSRHDVQGDEMVSPLPEGWTEYVDPSSGRPYYYNTFDGTTTWDRPTISQTQDMDHEESKDVTDVPVTVNVDDTQGNDGVQIEHAKNEPRNETKIEDGWYQGDETNEKLLSENIGVQQEQQQQQWGKSEDATRVQSDLVTNDGLAENPPVPSHYKHGDSVSSPDQWEKQRENSYGAYQAPARTRDVNDDAYHYHTVEQQQGWNQPVSSKDDGEQIKMHQHQQQWQVEHGRSLEQKDANSFKSVDHRNISHETRTHQDILEPPPRPQYNDQRKIEMQPPIHDETGTKTYPQHPSMKHEPHLEEKSGLSYDMGKEYGSGDRQWERQQQQQQQQASVGSVLDDHVTPHAVSKDQSSWVAPAPPKESNDKLEYSEQPRYFSQQQEIKTHELSRMNEGKQMMDGQKSPFIPSGQQQQHYRQQYQQQQQQQQWRDAATHQQHSSDHRLPSTQTQMSTEYPPSGTIPFVHPQTVPFQKEVLDHPEAPNQVKNEEETKPGIFSSLFGKKPVPEKQKLNNENVSQQSFQHQSHGPGANRPSYTGGPVHQRPQEPSIVDRSAARPSPKEGYPFQRSHQSLPQQPPQMYGAPRPHYGQYPQSHVRQQPYPPPPQPSQQHTGGQLQPYTAQQGEPGGSFKSILGNAWQGVLGFSEKAKITANQYKDIAIQEASKVTESVSTQSAGILGRVKSQAESIQKSFFDADNKPIQDEYSMSPYGNVQTSGTKQHQPPSGHYPPQNYGGYPREFIPPVPRGIQAYPHQQGIAKHPNQYPPGSWQGHPEQRPPMQSQYGQTPPNYPQRYLSPEERVHIQGQATERQNPIPPQGARSNAPGWSQQPRPQVPNQPRNPDKESYGDGQSNPWSHPGLDGF